MLVHQILKNKVLGGGTEGVVTIGPDRTLADAARLLAERRIGAAIVSADGAEVQGIISERDIVRELGRRGPDCLGESLSSLMTRELVTTGPDASVDDVLKVMTEGRFRHLPVMRDGRMIGLISIGDAVKCRLDELSMEKDALSNMIMGH